MKAQAKFESGINCSNHAEADESTKNFVARHWTNLPHAERPGTRLRKFPKSTITIVGCNDQSNAAEKKNGLSKTRATTVLTYLRDIWGISEKRMKLVARDLPAVPSNRDDSLGLAENRRVEILCDDWDIIKPVVDRTPVISASSSRTIYRQFAAKHWSVPSPHSPNHSKWKVVINGKTVYRQPPPPPAPPSVVRTLTILQRK